MGKLNFLKINKKYICNFLESTERHMSKQWIIWAGIANLIALWGGVFIIEKSFSISLIALIISMGILINLGYFLLKIENNQMKLNLYFGVYSTLWAVSGTYFLFCFFEKYFGIGMLIGGIIALANCIIALTTILVVIKRIKKDYYAKKRKMPSLVSGAAIFAILIARLMRNQRLLLFGIGGIFIVLASASNVYFLIMYYAYKLIEDTDIK